MASRIALLLAACSSAVALYTAKDDVLQLDEASFDKTVAKGSGFYMVEFYAPWCGHCKSLAPAWKEAAKALKGVVGVVAVDATQAQGLASKYKVEGFPTIKFFGADKSKPVDYSGARDAAGIVNYAMGQVSSAVKARMGGKADKSAGAGSAGAKKPGAGAGKASADSSQPGGGKQVTTLTADNFDELVYGSGTPWMVEFYAPWCGHCKSLAPEWAEAADQLSGEVKFGAVDATAHTDIGNAFNVKGYPTIVMFPGGAKGPKDARPYNGPRTAADLVAAAQSLQAESGGSVSAVSQLTSQSQWTEMCGGGKRVCVLAVLPHILDDGAAKRESRISTLTEAATKQRGRPFRFFWSQVGEQPTLENALNVGLVPAVFAVSGEKKVYTAHKGAFTADALSLFATALTSNKGASGAVPLPANLDLAKAISATTEWDGKDAAPPSDGDEMSLDELDL